MTWDGDITDKVVASDGQHYLILEDVSCADALKEYGGGITLSTGGAGYGVTGDGVTVDGDCLAVKDYVIVALANNAVSNGITYPRKGIYFKSSEDEYVSSFATNSADYLFPIVVSKDKLGEKYLPDSVIMEDDLNAYDVEFKAYIDAKIASSGGTSAPSAEGVAF